MSVLVEFIPHTSDDLIVQLPQCRAVGTLKKPHSSSASTAVHWWLSQFCYIQIVSLICSVLCKKHTFSFFRWEAACSATSFFVCILAVFIAQVFPLALFQKLDQAPFLTSSFGILAQVCAFFSQNWQGIFLYLENSTLLEILILVCSPTIVLSTMLDHLQALPPSTEVSCFPP